MKKKRLMRLALCLALVLAVVPFAAQAVGGVAINEKTFPDETFREYVIAEFDADKDGVLSASEVENAREIDLSGTDAADLTGLASLTGLKTLNISGTQIAAVTPAKNPALETLNAHGCPIKSLDVTKNAALRELDVSDTLLTALNTSKNPALELLNVSNCAVKALDVSKNTALTTLLCANTQLSSLNVTKNAALTELDCSGIGLSALDLSGNEALEILACGGNKLQTLDTSVNTALRELRCQENRLSGLDLSLNEALETLSCGKNALNWLNVSGNPALKELYCEENLLTAMYLSDNPALERLNCSKNMLSELSVKENPALEWLECSSNAIGSLNVTNNRWLTHLVCNDNLLHKLNISKNPEMEWIECWGNDIHALDISYSSKLMNVYRYGATVEYKRYTVRSYAQGGNAYEIGVGSDVFLQDGSVAAPLITAQPKDASAVEGKKVTFSMSAVGEGLFYQWYYRQPGSDTWVKLPGESGRNLTLTANKNNNGYRYLCEVINRGGLEQTERVRLTVISTPVITTQPGNQSGPDGEKVTFMVVASGEQLTYQWYRLTPGSSTWDKVNSGTSAKLTLTANAAHDGTKYRCVVKNEAGKVTSAEAKLTTIYKPSVTTQPVDAHVKKGEYTTFTVKASGGGLRYQWYMKLQGEKSWTLMNGETGRTLEVRGTPKRDRSVYRCQISNVAGHVYTDTVTLYVN